MKNTPTKRTRLTLIGILPAVALAVAATVLPGVAERGTTRVGPETQMTGLTVAEQATRQRELYERLSVMVPAGVQKTPLLVEISQRDRDDLAVPVRKGFEPLRVGVVKPVLDAIGKPFGKAFNHGIVASGPDGGFVWALTVNSPGAQTIRVHFTGFSLPENTEMYFLGAHGQARGPYVADGRNSNGDFWTRSIVAETGTILLRYSGVTPDVDRPRMSFVISDVAHIQGRPPRSMPESHDTWPCSDNAPCVVDVNCVNTGPAAPAEDAVAKMEWIQLPYIYTCTGGLLADTDCRHADPLLPDGEPLCGRRSNLQSPDLLQLHDGFLQRRMSRTAWSRAARRRRPAPYRRDGGGNRQRRRLHASDASIRRPPAGATFLGWNNAPVANHQWRRISTGSAIRTSGRRSTRSMTSTPRLRQPVQRLAARSAHLQRGSDRSHHGRQQRLAGAQQQAGEVVGQLSGCCGFNCADECDAANNWTVDGALAVLLGFGLRVSSIRRAAAPPDAECNDGLFCTGTETCVTLGNCQSSGDPCSGGDRPATRPHRFLRCAGLRQRRQLRGGRGLQQLSQRLPRRRLNGNPNGRYCCDGDLPGLRRLPVLRERLVLRRWWRLHLRSRMRRRPVLQRRRDLLGRQLPERQRPVSGTGL